MEDFKQQLFNERNELEIKYLALSEFLAGEYKIPDIQFNLLLIQQEIMKAYLRILETRIELLLNVN